MARLAPPYPPAPKNVPPDLTRPTGRYRFQVVVVLVSLMLFFLLYLTLLGAAAYLVYLAITFPLTRVNGGVLFLKIGSVAGSMLLFLYLLKGFFKRQEQERSLRVEVTEEEQPKLFAFIEKLCEETNAPFPHRIYLSPEVNAAVFYNRSILSLFLPTPKNLLIGLGLVNTLNLTEFKAVLAHEFGHFSQSSMKLGTYVYTANRILGDMVYARDWLDYLLYKLRHTDARIAVFAWAFQAVLWVLRKLMEGFYRAITFLDLALSRQMEFNADLVAVSVAGSDAIVHSLSRLNFATDSLMQAWQDLQTAADHRLYTCDLFYHQSHAASYLRRRRKDPHLGEPPPLPDDPMLSVAIFDEEHDPGIPPMWSSHPPNFDREQNAKRHYLRSVIDERSPWVLFDDVRAVREKVTWRFYRVVVKLRRDVELAEPEEVQAFIDAEHAETTYHPRYHGVYDDRYITPGNLSELTTKVREEPWDAGRLERVHAKLYDDELKAWVKEHRQRLEEYQTLLGAHHGEGKKGEVKFRGRRYDVDECKRLMKKVERELDADRDWENSLDRRVFLVHYQMAQQLGGRVATEMVERYEFHLAVQEIHRKLRDHWGRVEGVLHFLSGQREQLASAQYRQVLEVFREAHETLESSLRKSRNQLLPELSNVTTGQPLREFLLEKRLIYSLVEDEESLRGDWITKFLKQFGEVRDKLVRIDLKSLGGILQLQEKIGKQWLAKLAALPEVVPVKAEERKRQAKGKP